MSHVVMYLMKNAFAFDKHVTSPRCTLATHSTLAPLLTLALSEYNNPLGSLGTKYNLNTVPNCPGILCGLSRVSLSLSGKTVSGQG